MVALAGMERYGGSLDRAALGVFGKVYSAIYGSQDSLMADNLEAALTVLQYG